MDLETIRFALSVLAPASWLGLAALRLVAPRVPRIASLAAYTASFLASAFVTRLAIEHHQSRSQIACFALGALVIQAIRPRQAGGFSAAFWIAATAAGALGISAADRASVQRQHVVRRSALRKRHLR